ncbi:class I SAM-dependent methyltransferase [Chitinophaga japonensis]|uniref:S-adenosyl-L-methionine-dependent methyltransferase n=1 Tax=Chitinophaga japonensis TaxID=104662 RepID=A0A562SIX2_CHIJA|nr:SAM-dependent methyltransferase [Chitinophaga japonensis]TWI81053.1 methyltransferase (TIGR00027 family) [Chitinophaga japonensis]
MRRQARASRSTVLIAFFRAIESNRPARKRLFHDPYAIHFLPPALKMWASLSAWPFFRWFVPWYINTCWPGSQTAVVARTRLIDVMTVNTIRDHGINQVIILGAGLDTRAHRLRIRERVQFVEVDRPITQQFKQEQLSKVRQGPYTHVDYIAMDFKNQHPCTHITGLMQGSHYKTLFIWEGATNNLTASVGNTMFRYFQAFPPGTRIIFNYVDRRVLEDPGTYYGAVNVDRLLKRIAEPWNVGLDPSYLPHFLAGYNMELVFDEGAADYRERYFGKKARKIRGYEFYRVAMAVVR